MKSQLSQFVGIQSFGLIAKSLSPIVRRFSTRYQKVGAGTFGSPPDWRIKMNDQTTHRLPLVEPEKKTPGVLADPGGFETD
ncbi:hypothetical protein EBX31_15100 [bacterium]|nr:hypothetical protein [bacterium]